eukprot:CAMPEP_0206238214 /NCGR_PEP_ID=MMETSP0047_2-20121206/14699_1 /ASSEMBLY_ACC=CAM_ASM_000192 /TAXON_ID=195065 /ORGANISM="Chroomonas mesostigmatica_cf, Strain CCMP1168" /LENGTH=429 /DNA_ID=CAMNT_0053662741 /DNA_START=69 /DNA_END=1355 /DNA_ORIENTATION=+
MASLGRCLVADAKWATVTEALGGAPLGADIQGDFSTGVAGAFAQLLYKYCPQRPRAMSGLERAFKGDEAAAREFWGETLPFMAARALELPSLFPGRVIGHLPAGRDGQVSMSRRHASCLLFLCTFNEESEAMKSYNRATLLPLLVKREKQENAKLRCFMNYFNRIRREEPEGNLCFIRTSVGRGGAKHTRPDGVDWAGSSRPLLPLTASADGTIEDTRDALHVDFANRMIGGGVISGGCVQEEIRFAICPELTVSLLLCEAMGEKEAILISGFERFSSCTGYAGTLDWGGDHRDPCPWSADGSLASIVTCIDATDYRLRGYDIFEVQLEREVMQRELLKSFAGFNLAPWGHVLGERASLPTVATGNWGCGAFGGHKEIKALLQWMSASQCGLSVRYMSFGEREFAEELGELCAALVSQGVTVGQLWAAC